MRFTFIRPKQVVEITGRSKSDLYARIRRGLFPAPLKMSASVSAWPDYEVDELNAAVIAGVGDDELKVLVSDIVARRPEALAKYRASVEG